MAYKLLRKDLTETTRKCNFCPRYLTSLKAYVLEDIVTGEIVYAGPSCTKKNISSPDDISRVPDLTKFTMTGESGEKVGHGGGSSGGVIVDDPRRRALEYLALREEKLVNDFHCSFIILRNYFTKYKNGSLDELDVRHINNIEKNAPDKYKLKVLSKCYNYLFWIDVAIEKLPDDKRGYLEGIRATIVREYSISVKQKDAVNRWLSNIKGVPQLK